MLQHASSEAGSACRQEFEYFTEDRFIFLAQVLGAVCLWGVDRAAALLPSIEVASLAQMGLVATTVRLFEGVLPLSSTPQLSLSPKIQSGWALGLCFAFLLRQRKMAGFEVEPCSFRARLMNRSSLARCSRFEALGDGQDFDCGPGRLCRRPQRWFEVCDSEGLVQFGSCLFWGDALRRFDCSWNSWRLEFGGCNTAP